MSSRSEKWIIHERQNGSWDLSRNRTSFYTNMDSKAEAIRRLKAHYKPGQRVLVEDPAGERVNVTEQLRRGGFL